MVNKKRLGVYTEIDENTSLAKLSILDQLRAIFSRMAQDDARELENDDAFAIDEATRKANLEDFLRKATKPIREGRHTSVSMRISSDFESVYDDVVNSPSITKYYNVKTVRPRIDYEVHYSILLRLEVKVV